MTPLDHVLAAPAAIAGLVEYQSDSVVSRVVFRNDGGTLTAFAFAEGQGLSEHSNPNDAIVFVLDGAVDVIIDRTKHRVSVGEALHLPPSVPHELVGGAAFKMLLLLLKRPREG